MILGEPKPNKYDWKWKWMGVPIRVHFSFWIVAAIFGLLFGGISTKLGIGNLWLFSGRVAAIFVAILLHEMGHALVGRRFGSQGVRIMMYAMGGMAYNATGRNRKQRMLVIFAGPLASILLGLAALYFYFYLPLVKDNLYLRDLLGSLIWVGLGWGVFNLVPVYPLDGGQLLGEVLDAKRPRDGMIMTHRTGIVLSIILATLGLVWGQLFLTLIFAQLAYVNFKALQHERMRPW